LYTGEGCHGQQSGLRNGFEPVATNHHVLSPFFD
jgi:hypothetical protein